MSPTWVEVIIGVVTFVASAGTAAFISGTHWGELRADVKLMNDRLAKIEGMFTLRLRDHDLSARARPSPRILLMTAAPAGAGTGCPA
jgi:hypothetical protein